MSIEGFYRGHAEQRNRYLIADRAIVAAETMTERLVTNADSGKITPDVTLIDGHKVRIVLAEDDDGYDAAVLQVAVAEVHDRSIFEGYAKVYLDKDVPDFDRVVLYAENGYKNINSRPFDSARDEQVAEVFETVRDYVINF